MQLVACRMLGASLVNCSSHLPSGLKLAGHSRAVDVTVYMAVCSSDGSSRTQGNWCAWLLCHAAAVMVHEASPLYAAAS
jgi:hypothetical protein